MHEEIDLLSQITSELFRIKRLKRTLDHLLEWNEKSGLVVDDDLFEPADGTGDGGGCPRHRCLHFLGDFFCIGGTGAKHDLKILIHELDRAHEVNDPLLARDSANEKYERLRAIDPESVE